MGFCVKQSVSRAFFFWRSKSCFFAKQNHQDGVLRVIFSRTLPSPPLVIEVELPLPHSLFPVHTVPDLRPPRRLAILPCTVLCPPSLCCIEALTRSPVATLHTSVHRRLHQTIASGGRSDSTYSSLLQHHHTALNLWLQKLIFSLSF
jgi:hypothetical protein